MTITLRQEIDDDRYENATRVSEFKSKPNFYEVYCGVCGKVFYTDKDYSALCGRTIEHGHDNPFQCDDCKTEYEELSRETH